jgi:hypothetical protein
MSVANSVANGRLGLIQSSFNSNECVGYAVKEKAINILRFRSSIIKRKCYYCYLFGKSGQQFTIVIPSAKAGIHSKY